MQELISKIKSKRLFAFAGLLWFLHDMAVGLPEGNQRLFLATAAGVAFLILIASYMFKDDTTDVGDAPASPKAGSDTVGG